MPASPNEQCRAGKTDSAIERQIADSFAEGIIGLAKHSAAITNVSFDIRELPFPSHVFPIPTVS